MNKLKYIFLALIFAFTASAQQIPVAPDNEERELQVFFDGQWLPSVDPAEIGMKNYSELKNLRYGPEAIGLEGVSGYSKINTTALTTYTKIRSGFQLNTNYTNKSYVLVQAENAAEDGSRVYVNSTAIPSQGDFSSSVELDTSGHAYLADSSGAGLGRFSAAPNNSVTYANGVQTLIWSGEEMRIAAAYVMANADPNNSGAYPVDKTEHANTNLTTKTITLNAATSSHLFLMTTRPIQGVYFDVVTPNASASTLSATYWNGSWTAVANASDGTDTGPALAQDGWYTFDYTSDADPYHYLGNYYYGYVFSLDAGSAAILRVSVNAPMQSMVDLWDGIPRQPIQLQVWRNGDSKFKDWTLEVNEYSYEAAPFIAQLDALGTLDYILVMSDDRLSGIKFEFMAGWVNTAATVINVEYWDGDSYTSLTEIDETSLGGDSFGQNGLVWWNPPGVTAEAKKKQFGVTGYSYRVTFSVQLSGTYSDESDIMTEAGDVALDVVTVYPAQKELKPFKFTSQYKNRVFACGDVQGSQGNRCDYTQKYSTEIWNGADSSDDGIQSIYFETSEDLTAAKSVYNYYGNRLIEALVVWTATETHVLQGDSPEDFTTTKASENVGCPAPLTATRIETGYEIADGLKRNIVMWLSNAGPYGFDGGVIFPIKGIDNYFDSDNTECINFDEIGRARAFYDDSHKEWNLLIPSGSSQTTNNVWLVYDLVKKKWFRKDTGTASFPQVGFSVKDIYGKSYIYGGIDSGYMMRLENGNSWDGTGIEQIVETGDFWPTNNIWDLTRIRKIKVMAKRMASSYELRVSHASDTDDSLGLSGAWQSTDDGEWENWEGGEWVNASLLSVSLNLSDSINRIARDTVQNNLYGWAHRFKFEMTTDDATKGLQPLGWGAMYQVVDRKDE